MSEIKLREEIIARSNGSNWDVAEKEWYIFKLYRSENETCLCGHRPIMKVCILKNKLNAMTVRVGNCCVKKFSDLPSDNIFESLKMLNSDQARYPSLETMRYARQQRWITDDNFMFFRKVMRKRELTPGQIAYKLSLNKQILSRFAMDNIRFRNAFKDVNL